MTKAQRIEFIKTLQSEGKTDAEIIEMVMAETSVSEITVKKDLREIIAAEETPEKEGVTIISIDLTEDEKNRPALAKGRVTEYELKHDEADNFHVELEKTEFEGSTGLKKSKPYVQIFHLREWLNFRKHAHKLGFTHVRIIWAPEGTKPEVLELPTTKK